MTVWDVWGWINQIAPFDTQEAFDNAGLLLGHPEAEVTRVLFAVDATLPVIHEASEWDAELIVTHHPLMFGGIHTIRYDQPEGEALALLAGERLNLIAAHTNLDQAAGGVGDSLAEALGLTAVSPVEGSHYLRTGRLSKAQSASDFLSTVNQALGAHTRMYGDPTRRITRAVVGAGALGEEYALAAARGAQAFVVGEIKHHQILVALALGLVIYEAGHDETERPGIAALHRRFQSAAQEARWDVRARLTTIPPYECATEAAHKKGQAALRSERRILQGGHHGTD